MKYRVRLLESYLKEVLSTPQIGEIVLQKIPFYMENPRYILTAEIKDEKGNEITFNSPLDVLHYLDKRKQLPDNIRGKIASYVNNFDVSREEALKLILKKNPDINTVLTLMTKDLPTRQQVGKIADESRKNSANDILHALSKY